MGLVGVDEAGKGPVLGSMFAAAVRVVDETSLPSDVDDSKRLTAERRERLVDELRSAAELSLAVAEVPVDRIDDPATDMNGLTVAAQVGALSKVARPDDVVRCDASDVDAERFGRRVARRLAASDVEPVDVRAEHRADERHAVVGAASVVAKVARDDHVAALSEAYGDLGSGYPSDPRTAAFLERYVDDHGGLPDCARASWRTSERVLAKAEESGLSGF